MTEYQKSDVSVMLSDIYLVVNSLQEETSKLSQNINSLTLDIDTMIRSMETFNRQLAEQKQAILSDVAKTSAEIVAVHLEELRKNAAKDESKKRWFIFK
ncbi:hypothetical protein [Dichelobacter nodosus]|uniref:hypothetical protein n=1 Tax=Dichelobacter nodosus TaxID=870 RepID=UPI00068172B8|nr:hypothetical protein [Dichelobacter nodosus]KNZ39931.1 hypothetical protein AKG33_00835 [Dichelobacter nodosus]